MASLFDTIQDQTKRRAVVDDSQAIIEAEVATKNFIIKGAFKLVRGIKPGFIPMAIDNLIDDFARELDPHFNAWIDEGKNGPLSSWFSLNGSQIANDLLRVTDSRAEDAKHKTVKKAYGRLRPKAVEHVRTALPRVADMLEKHVE
jgi:hypothetical protein